MATSLTITSAKVLPGGGTSLSFVVGGSPTTPITASNSFTVEVSPPINPGGAASYTTNAVTGNSVSGTTVTLTLTSAVPAGHQVAISATAASLSDNAGNTLPTVTRQIIGNNSDALLTYGGSTEINKSGVFIPTGSLNVYRTAAAAAGTNRCEVSFVGDSTTEWGDSTDRSIYLTTVRALSKAAGRADGGRGGAGTDDTSSAGLSGENITIVKSKDVGTWAGSISLGPLMGGGFKSTTSGDKVTFQGYGSVFRLQYSMTSWGCGEFTYSIDGGTATTFRPLTQNPNMGRKNAALGWDAYSVEIPLGSDGYHTVQITNGNGTPTVVTQSTSVLTNQGTASPAFSGDQYYVFTRVIGGGESYPTAEIKVTAPGTQAPKVLVNDTVNTYNVYRGTSANGPFNFVAQATVQVSPTGWSGIIDTNLSTTSQTPPDATTAVLDATKANVNIKPEFIKSQGIVYQKDALSGQATTNYLGNPSGVDNYCAQLDLGLLPGNSSGHDYSQPAQSGSPFRNTVLQMYSMGINDASSANTDTTTMAKQVNIGRVMAGQKGAPFAILVPSLSRGFQGVTSLPWINALKNVAILNGLPYFDCNVFLDVGGYATYTQTANNPHLVAEGADYEAFSLWGNFLAPTAADASAPAVPTGLTAISGTANVTLTWNPVADSVNTQHALFYDVFRDGSQVGTSLMGQNSYVDTGLTNGVSHSYTVRARDYWDNASAQSSSVTSTPTAAAGAVIQLAAPRIYFRGNFLVAQLAGGTGSSYAMTSGTGISLTVTSNGNSTVVATGTPTVHSSGRVRIPLASTIPLGATVTLTVSGTPTISDSASNTATLVSGVTVRNESQVGSFTVSAPASGPINSPATVTVTGQNGLLFDGTASIQITDDKGATTTVTPVAGSSSGTASYTPTVIGSRALSAQHTNGALFPTTATFSAQSAPSGSPRRGFFMGTNQGGNIGLLKFHR